MGRKSWPSSPRWPVVKDGSLHTSLGSKFKFVHFMRRRTVYFEIQISLLEEKTWLLAHGQSGLSSSPHTSTSVELDIVFLVFCGSGWDICWASDRDSTNEFLGNIPRQVLEPMKTNRPVTCIHTALPSHAV